MLVALDLHLLVEGPGVEARGLGEHLVAKGLRHAMTLDEVEADVLEGVAFFADARQHALSRLEIDQLSGDLCAVGIEACKPLADLRLLCVDLVVRNG